MWCLAPLCKIHRDAFLIFPVWHIVFHVDALAQKLKLYLKLRLPVSVLSPQSSVAFFCFTSLACGRRHVIYFCGHRGPSSEATQKPQSYNSLSFYLPHTYLWPDGGVMWLAGCLSGRIRNI